MELPVELTVFRDRFRSTEQKLGMVTFNGEHFDYGHLDATACEEMKRILESPATIPVGFAKSDGYGHHSVQEQTYEPFTSEHLLAVTNRPLPGGLSLVADSTDLLF